MKKARPRHSVRLEPISRRTLLRSSLGLAVGLPLLESMAPSQAGATTTKNGRPKRFIFATSPNGVVPEDWFPNNAPLGESPLKLNKATAPYAAVSEHVSILQGINNHVSKNGHYEGMGSLLTGTNPSIYPDSGKAVAQHDDLGNSISVDQFIARKIVEKEPDAPAKLCIPLINNIGHLAQPGVFHISYLGARKIAPKVPNPAELYKELFKGTASTATVERLRQRRISVLDDIRNDYRRFQSRLSANDKHRIDAHFTAIEEVERRLNLNSRSCEQLQPIAATTDHINHLPEMVAANFELMRMAMVCDLSRIFTYVIRPEGGVPNLPHPWLGLSNDYHPVSHQWATAPGRAHITKVDSWYSTIFAKFIADLKDTEDGPGRSLLDNLLFVHSSANARGDHSVRNLPVLLAGSLGGTLKTGKSFRFADQPLGRLLLSFVHAMGHTEVSRFGTNGDARIDQLFT